MTAQQYGDFDDAFILQVYLLQESVEMQEQLRTENRLLAALAHGSVAMQGLGVLVGVVIYVTQRDKSRYTAFQALQAAVYQLVNGIIIGALWVVWGAFYAISVIGLLNMPNTGATPPPQFFIALGSMMIPFALMLIVVIYGLWAAIRTWQGREFRYPVLGGWLERSGLWNAK